MSDFTNKQTDALKEFLFENNFDRTPMRETCFRKGYELGFAQAQSELTPIGVTNYGDAVLMAHKIEIDSLRTRLASAEEALGFYADIDSWEATGWDAQDLIDDSDIEEMKGEDLPKGGKRAREHFGKFPPSDK
jgi:hypothetical protein